jgi:hypothetical protein
MDEEYSNYPELIAYPPGERAVAIWRGVYRGLAEQHPDLFGPNARRPWEAQARREFESRKAKMLSEAMAKADIDWQAIDEHLERRGQTMEDIIPDRRSFLGRFLFGG